MHGFGTKDLNYEKRNPPGIRFRQYEFKEDSKGNIVFGKEVRKSQVPDILFLERCV